MWLLWSSLLELGQRSNDWRLVRGQNRCVVVDVVAFTVHARNGLGVPVLGPEFASISGSRNASLQADVDLILVEIRLALGIASGHVVVERFRPSVGGIIERVWFLGSGHRVDDGLLLLLVEGWMWFLWLHWLMLRNWMEARR